MKEHLLSYIDTAKTASVRGLRILVEYFYALEIFEPILKSKVKIVSVFGSARLKSDTKEYQDAKKIGQLLYENGYAVVTGASKGIMQAANEGVSVGIIEELKKNKKFKTQRDIIDSEEYKKKLYHYSVGLKISLPFEPDNNPFLGVVATFHYFMVRKFFFGTLSSAFVACEGGWGTRDELFEILTLVQTGKAPLMPIIYISPKPKHLLDDIKFSVEEGYISPEDQSLLDVVSDYRKAVAIINRFYSVVDRLVYDKEKTVEIFLTRDPTPAQKQKIKSLVTAQYAKVFADVVFTRKKMELTGFNYKSYGIVRKLIDIISEQ